ncbi:MAG: DUF4299 family protein [Oscillospiraceae bacterium]|nr:DUF4299 family protein [Oscillospiraceae bacterium]
MSVNIEIKPNDYNPKSLSIPEIARLMGLKYGYSDNHYCLEENKIGTYTILYDPQKIGRGFEVWYENDTICLRLPLPTTSHDIDIFYTLVEKICNKLDVYFFNCEGETVAITDVYANVDNDKNSSMGAIRHIRNNTADDDTKYMILFGALNPVFIGQNECAEIGDELVGFDNFMHRIQSIDAFYATPRFYQREDQSVFGVYFVGENIVTTVPLNPASPYHKIDSLDSYFVHLPDGNSVLYEDFINNVMLADYYDAGHITVKLSEEMITDLVDRFAVHTTTKERINGIYWGKTLDYGYWHTSKPEKMGLDIDSINGYNHIAVFLRWAKENKYLSEELISRCPEILEEKPDYRKLLDEHYAFDRKLRIKHLKEKIQPFARKFYVFGDNGFPVCVDRYAEKVLGSEKYHCDEYKDEAYLFVPYDEEYYKGLSEYITKAFEEFNNK